MNMNLSNRQFLFLALLLSFCFLGCNQTTVTPGTESTASDKDGATDPNSADSSGSSRDVEGPESKALEVRVLLEFNGRKENRDLTIDCPSGTTVFQATVLALREAEISIGHTKNVGEMAFVKSIDGVVNEKSAGDNWIYRVNGELGKVGCGAMEVADGDRITWSFGEYELAK